MLGIIYSMKYSVYKGPRTNHSNSLHIGAFGERLEVADIVLDVGAGDSEFAECRRRIARRVISLDPQYAIEAPANSKDAVAGDGRSLPLRDEVVDATISMLMMRQLPHGSGDISSAIGEMIRVTKSFSSYGHAGTVSIFPVYHPERAQWCQDDSISGLVDIGYPNYDYLSAHHPRFVYPTLTLYKKPGIDPCAYADIAEQVENSEILRPDRGVGYLARAAYTLVTGKTRFRLSD